MTAPKLFRIETEEDLERIPFENGMAAVEVPADLLEKLELKHADRGDSLRLRALEKSIRASGFRPVEPITARIGRKGRWIVVNGGHRLTAARHVMQEFWANLFGKKVNSFYFILFTNPDSWKKSGRPDGIERDEGTSEELRASRDAWERAGLRRNIDG
ncbi:MAG: ParB/RepB/Spo0J family partition protein [Rhodobacteraceae bacterium]|nr:ParB/RepB/Spo0J family partition protein [Paracoccaceae bacterium]